MRVLTSQEQDILMQFADRLPDELRLCLLRDLKGCQVEEKGENGSRLEFQLMGYERPPYHGQHAYPVEGVMLDQDGAEVSVYVYADENDRLIELEFVKWADAPLKALQWNSFQLLY